MQTHESISRKIFSEDVIVISFFECGATVDVCIFAFMEQLEGTHDVCWQ